MSHSTASTQLFNTAVETDPYHWITDTDPDPDLFFSGFQDANTK
jgi:hypothetical protein